MDVEGITGIALGFEFGALDDIQLIDRCMDYSRREELIGDFNNRIQVSTCGVQNV
jgi:hypothetical protein